jgi:hypothetical protein
MKKEKGDFFNRPTNRKLNPEYRMCAFCLNVC